MEFCPDTIVSQTDELSDGEFEQYVDVIQCCSDLHVAHVEVPHEDRTTLIEHDLYDTASGSYLLLRQVQMRALDRRL